MKSLGGTGFASTTFVFPLLSFTKVSASPGRGQTNRGLVSPARGVAEGVDVRVSQATARKSQGARLRAAVAGQHRAETRLQESEEHFGELVAGVHDYAVFLLDADGNVLTWNAGAERIKGYRADEIIGQHFSRFYPSDTVSSGWPAHELQVAAAMGRFEDQGWRMRKDGTRFLGQRRHHRLARPVRECPGVPQDHARHDRPETSRGEIPPERGAFPPARRGVKDYAIFMLDPQGRVATWNAGAASDSRATARRRSSASIFPFSIPGKPSSAGWPDEEMAIAAPRRQLRG